MTSQRIGLVSSLGLTLDAFFPEIVSRWHDSGYGVSSVAGTAAETMPDHTVLTGMSRKPSPLRMRRATRQLNDWHLRVRPDVIITNTATASSLVRMTSSGIPVIYFCHGLHWRNNHSAEGLTWKVIERALLARTQGVLTLNHQDNEWFERNGPLIPRHRLKWGVGVDTARFARTSPNPSSRAVLWAGEFIPRKNPFAALHTFRALSNAEPDTRLVMLGEGPLLGRVMSAAKQLGLGTRVDFPGRQDPVPYINSSRVVIHTAIWEGLPRILLEALATGRPVAAFSAKGTDDLPVYRVPQGDTEGLARTISHLMRQESPVLPAPEAMSSTVVADDILQVLRRWRILR